MSVQSLEEFDFPRRDGKLKTLAGIRQHMVCEKSSILRIPGVWLKPGEPENAGQSRL